MIIATNYAIEVDNQQYITENTKEEDNEDAEIGLVNYVEIKELDFLTPEQLQGYFQEAYDMGLIAEGSLEEQINLELEMLVELVARQEKGKLPEDYEQQYRAWRPAEPAAEVEQQVEAEPEQPAVKQEIQLFEDSITISREGE